MDNSKKIRISRRLAKILRHRALDYELKISDDGYVDVKDLFKLNDLNGLNLEMLEEIVNSNSKNRFSIKREKHNIYVRANQGHSIKSVLTHKLLEPIIDPCQCIHATTFESLRHIKKLGLNRMTRNTIHFSESYPAKYIYEDNLILSEDKIKPPYDVLIYVDMEKAMKDSIKFWKSKNGVILSEGINGTIDSKYFLRYQDIS
jgi:2'-phosphotransferase